MNINWDLAADGTATKLVTCEDAVYWAKDGYFWDNNGKSWIRCNPDYEFITIATRPQQKRKTVEDAVDYLNQTTEGRWDSEFNNIHYDPHHHGWFYGSDAGALSTFVCTREQFEQCVKAKGEKWTHTYGGNKCKLIADNGELAWVEYVTGENYVVRIDNLKPIKPTMTEAQQSMVAKFVARIYKNDTLDLRAEFDAFCNEHDII